MTSSHTHTSPLTFHGSGRSSRCFIPSFGPGHVANDVCGSVSLDSTAQRPSPVLSLHFRHCPPAGCQIWAGSGQAVLPGLHVDVIMLTNFSISTLMHSCTCSEEGKEQATSQIERLPGSKLFFETIGNISSNLKSSQSMFIFSTFSVSSLS